MWRAMAGGRVAPQTLPIASHKCAIDKGHLVLLDRPMEALYILLPHDFNCQLSFYGQSNMQPFCSGKDGHRIVAHCRVVGNI